MKYLESIVACKILHNIRLKRLHVWHISQKMEIYVDSYLQNTNVKIIWFIFKILSNTLFWKTWLNKTVMICPQLLESIRFIVIGI